MLNTANPNCFVYEAGELLIELLGGVRVDTLDRMRVTIKVVVVNRKHPQHTSEVAELAVRHNLDFYSPHSVLSTVLKKQASPHSLTQWTVRFTHKCGWWKLGIFKLYLALQAVLCATPHSPLSRDCAEKVAGERTLCGE